MSKSPAKHPDLSLPLYADKPQRRIPGTNAVAVTIQRSDDNSIRQFAVIDAEAGHLGSVYYQHGSATRSRGYSMQQFPMFRDEVWPTLAAYVREMSARLAGGPS